MTAIPAGLPPAAQLIDEARAAMARGDRRTASLWLDRYGPDMAQLADSATAAEWLGLKPHSVYVEKSRRRADGAAAWPPPDETAGRSSMWTFRTLVLWRASMPGRGSAGRGRPRRPAPA